MKKINFILTALLAFALCGCSDLPGMKPPQQDNPDKVLVAYFSATGTTKGVAWQIAKLTGGDIYEITPVDRYTEEDLDWHNDKSRSSVEMHNPDSRPEIGGEPLRIGEYRIIYLGYPIWWGEAPHILYTFVESHKLKGKIVVPFCTSGPSPIGDSAKNLEKAAGGGTWLEGARFDANSSEKELQTLIDSVK